MVTLVGESSTGKTRACWEAVQRLPAQWCLWHPIDPGRPEAAVRALHEVGPRTVVWLTEAQHYLLTADPALGEQIAAGLRTLLADSSRGPVLVLATMWPQYWAALTKPHTHVMPDPLSQARHLLAGGQRARGLRRRIRDRAKTLVGGALARTGREGRYQSFVREADFRQWVSEAGLTIAEAKVFNTRLKPTWHVVPPAERTQFMRSWLDFELRINELDMPYTDRLASHFFTRNFVLAHSR